MSKRLSATDISALASMKNVAKCDTWCELQNPVNHRVAPDAIRLKARLPGRHAWRRPLTPCLCGRKVCERILAPRSRSCSVGLKGKSPTTDITASGGCQTVPTRRACCSLSLAGSSTPEYRQVLGTSTATPGQAGSPAEFKHINKRRKRNLQGFP